MTKFDGNEKTFDSFIQGLSDKFEEDVAIFRTEKSGRMYLMRLLECGAARSIETRYMSKTRLFSCLAEMIQVLEALYHDPNQASAVRDELSRLKFRPGKDKPIHQLIAEFISLAQKAKIPEGGWKQTLWEHIPSTLDTHLLRAYWFWSRGFGS
ncbi:hypothetical protein E0Z10_g2363 [Xylaria hypoxylon]|uniref:Uncharacterized protein n=1 Tax=Xylaria hypoxylon TaxID=37992 RepID=A0A4Z0YPY7_9PEZI|nr:hypothetical protein E0Z10_g2363 [Xylaria hypoxylon]